MKKIGIYKITNPKGNIYIGQSKDILKRIYFYKKGKCKSQAKLFHSLLKYGFDNHLIEIIEECPLEMLNEREIYWIKFYNSFNTEHGLNLQSGGLVCIVSDATREKQSEIKLGYKRSTETKAKISKNNARTRLGKPLTQDEKDKISKKVSVSLIGNKRSLGYKQSDETKLKHKNAIQSDEKRAKNSKASKLVWASLSPKEKKERTAKAISNRGFNIGNTGKKQSDETKRKIGEANRLRIRENKKQA